MEDKPNLPFTVATLQEIERLGSVIPLSIPRSSNKTFRWREYIFPKYSTISWNLCSLHRDPKYWENPESFNPNRFIDSNGKSFRPSCLMPFGSGRRACPGEALGKMEIFLYFTILLKNFHFECEKDKPIPPLTSIPGAARSPTEYKICCYSRMKADQEFSFLYCVSIHSLPHVSDEVSIISPFAIVATFFIPLNFTQTLLALFCVVMVFIYNTKKSAEECKLPPGPNKYISMLHIPIDLIWPKETIDELVKIHSDYGPIVAIDVFGSPLIFVNDIDMIKELSTHPDLQLRPSTGILMEMNQGLGIIGAEGELLKHQRRFLINALKNYGMGKLRLEEKITNELSNVINFLNATNGKPVSVFSVLEKSTSNVIFNLAFNKQFEYDDIDFMKRIKALGEVFKAFATSGILALVPFLKPFLKYILKQFYLNVNILKEQSQEFIDAHEKTLDPDNPRDLLDLYLLEMKKSEVDDDKVQYHNTFYFEQLKFLIIDLFAGGTETSNHTLRWALLYMIHNPDIQKKVQKELDDVIGNERLPSMEDKPNLPFTVATLQEIERLGSVIPISLPRSCNKTVRWRDYIFPIRSSISWTLCSLHRNPKLWKNPESFNPNRFIDSNGKSFRPSYLMPFGSGRRACPGEALAKMEIFLYFTILVKNFHFECEKDKPIPPLTSTITKMPSPLDNLCEGLPLDPLPEKKVRDETVAHAPIRTTHLTPEEEKIALRNALRYFPSEHHAELAPDFAEELKKYGHIYMYRFEPDFEIKAYPIDQYQTKSKKAAAIMHMIMNNLDPAVAQFPQELVTYGGNGQVFSNWAQFRLVMKYLSIMTEEQTLIMYSGHPLGLFPSSPDGPRLVITNGMVIPNYSSRKDYDRYFALGVSMQVWPNDCWKLLLHWTTGNSSWNNGPYTNSPILYQGLTILNAGRKYLGSNNLAGKVFLTSGLGGMSGAQGKAAIISGCIGVIAEVSEEALNKRYKQGWVSDKTSRKPSNKKLQQVLGTMATLWTCGRERLMEEYDKNGVLLVDLGSDQTSCHNPFNGGYYPVQLSFEESNRLMKEDPVKFKNLVEESLRRQVKAINYLADQGMFFWDYGNAFLLEARRAGADVSKPGDPTGISFRYPSYVQDIMGDIFSLGFGPFRWVCTSCNPADLETTDEIAKNVLMGIIKKGVSENTKSQYYDNIKWINDAAKHKMVVGSQARILYSDRRGRILIALAFNQAIRDGIVKGPIVISRDHHDVSGTDSPFRETANIYDGSAFTADMAIQNCIGDSFRGATWVAIHNGGGVGWQVGEVINGGFGLVLDGSEDASLKAKKMLEWDVNNGVARRCWSGNLLAKETIQQSMEENPNLLVTLPNKVIDENVLSEALSQ
ncbi:Urocanate hydratase [Nymphon striatum]|nr:Urocanate hydratase [Nymphon striatum]